MKKVARSKGARVAVSLDTGTVLRDLLQTVAPETPDSAGTGHSIPAHICCPQGIKAVLLSRAPNKNLA